MTNAVNKISDIAWTYKKGETYGSSLEIFILNSTGQRMVLSHNETAVREGFWFGPGTPYPRTPDLSPPSVMYPLTPGNTWTGIQTAVQSSSLMRCKGSLAYLSPARTPEQLSFTLDFSTYTTTSNVYEMRNVSPNLEFRGYDQYNNPLWTSGNPPIINPDFGQGSNPVLALEVRRKDGAHIFEYWPNIMRELREIRSGSPGSWNIPVSIKGMVRDPRDGKWWIAKKREGSDPDPIPRLCKVDLTQDSVIINSKRMDRQWEGLYTNTAESTTSIFRDSNQDRVWIVSGGRIWLYDIARGQHVQSMQIWQIPGYPSSIQYSGGSFVAFNDPSDQSRVHFFSSTHCFTLSFDDAGRPYIIPDTFGKFKDKRPNLFSFSQRSGIDAGCETPSGGSAGYSLVVKGNRFRWYRPRDDAFLSYLPELQPSKNALCSAYWDQIGPMVMGRFDQQDDGRPWYPFPAQVPTSQDVLSTQYKAISNNIANSSNAIAATATPLASYVGLAIYGCY